MSDNATELDALQGELTVPQKHQAALDAGLRNAYQWLAMFTMLLDHIGYIYSISALRYVGRLAMPIYAILFVTTIKSGHLHLRRLVMIALISQLPVIYIFEDPRLNIIFGFAVFGYAAQAVEQRRWFAVAAGVVMMFIPVSYGWYLYVTLAAFYWLANPWMQGGVFAIATGLYTWWSHIHPRQLLAILVPFIRLPAVLIPSIRRIRTPRPNKYLYRYFYPGHLYILAVLNYFYLLTVLNYSYIDSLTVPFINLRYSDIVLQIERFLQWLF